MSFIGVIQQDCFSICLFLSSTTSLFHYVLSYFGRKCMIKVTITLLMTSPINVRIVNLFSWLEKIVIWLSDRHEEHGRKDYSSCRALQFGGRVTVPNLNWSLLLSSLNSLWLVSCLDVQNTGGSTMSISGVIAFPCREWW